MGCENSKAAEVQSHNPPSDLEVEDVKAVPEAVAKASKAPKATKPKGGKAARKSEEPVKAPEGELQVETIATATEPSDATPAQDGAGTTACA